VQFRQLTADGQLAAAQRMGRCSARVIEEAGFLRLTNSAGIAFSLDIRGQHIPGRDVCAIARIARAVKVR